MSPRIPPPDPRALAPEVAEALSIALAPSGEPAATMEVLAHQGELLAPFLGWAAALHLNGVLTPREHELLALRAAWNCRSAFEWGEHCGYGRRAGLSEAELTAVAAGPDAGWSDHEAALLRAADQLHHGADVDDGVWAALAARHDEAALAEIVFVVGQYTMLSMVANAARVAVPADLDPLPPISTGPAAGC